jgi:hypothetical protein
MLQVATHMSADRNLLFGILALQMDFISRNTFAATESRRLVVARLILKQSPQLFLAEWANEFTADEPKPRPFRSSVDDLHGEVACGSFCLVCQFNDQEGP